MTRVEIEAVIVDARVDAAKSSNARHHVLPSRVAFRLYGANNYRLWWLSCDVAR